MNATSREDALTMFGFMDGQTTREDGASRASVASICRYWADEAFDDLDGEATAALRFCLTRAAELLSAPKPEADAGKVAKAEEQVRQDAADRMQHSTTSDLSARLMCRVGFRELTLLLAHYDGLKRAHADRTSEKPLRIPVELDEAKLPEPSRIIEPVTPETVFRAGDRVRWASNEAWETVARVDRGGRPVFEADGDLLQRGWSKSAFDRIERASR